jgi:transglutaminase-like putative cysteine protease
MKRLLLIAACSLCVLSAFAESAKTFDATYVATLRDVPAGLKSLDLWIPLPTTRGTQTVSDVVIESPWTFSRKHDAEFGNEYAFARVAHPPAGEVSVRVRFRVTRREESEAAPAERRATRAELARALRADRLVTLSPRVRKLAAEVTAGKTTPIEQAHAIFEHLVTTMTYDKTAPGWGNGDTERACDIKKGNCTDFHSLFLSLARARGIPARFVIGFPLTAADGHVAGYHCWAEFYVKGRGWIPVDASDASKLSDPAAREYLFGHLDPNRVQFTIGRDLHLTPRTAEPLNFFIYPHAEAKGETVGVGAVALDFHPASGGTAVAAVSVHGQM